MTMPEPQYYTYLTTDQATTNTTATNVTGLSFPVQVNQIYTFQFNLVIGSSSNAGVKYALTFPTGATLLAIAFGVTTSATTFTTDRMTVSGTLGSTFNTVPLNTGAIPGLLEIHGTFVNGGTAGTVQLQHAKVTSGTATIYANSYLFAQRQ